MALYQTTAGDRILAADINQYYNILKGVAASGETVTLIYNNTGAFLLQPSSDPAAGTEMIQVKNNAGTRQIALTNDGKVKFADGTTQSTASALGSFTGCRIYKAAAQSINVTTYTSLQFDTEAFDTATMHDTVTNNTRITFGTAGYYNVGIAYGHASGTTGNQFWSTRIYLNNATVIAQKEDFGGASGLNLGGAVQTIYSFAQNDYIEFQAYNDTGASKNALLNGAQDAAWAYRVG